MLFLMLPSPQPLTLSHTDTPHHIHKPPTLIPTDNHDVISLVTYADHAVMEQAEVEKSGNNKTLFESDPVGMTMDTRLER